MPSILFSIIIPTYNRAALISDTINSCIGQSYANFEVIVVDDGGSDNTEEVIKNTYSNESRIRYFWKENEERGAARNFGIERAKGDYILFLDSDDLMEEYCLANYAAKIEAQDFPDVLYCNYRFKIGNRFEKSNVDNWAEGWYSWHKFLMGNHFASLICFKSGVDNIKVPEERDYTTSEDWVFNLFKTYGKDFYYTGDLGFTMREHDGRSMNADQMMIIDTKINALELVLKTIQLKESEKKTIKSFAYYFAAIHAYVGRNRAMGYSYLSKVGREVPFKKRAVLRLKLFIGRKRLLMLKSALNK